ncbi:MAG: hypothetical protein JWQ06_902 [Mucilaginibacter sp.]|nr:hypothetical protein [Mucilaginibacter sp.]
MVGVFRTIRNITHLGWRKGYKIALNKTGT